ncbi:IclR family transcriptional regulator C-terminal domain-containing protein, partial [Acinetobacter baumannii]
HMDSAAVEALDVHVDPTELAPIRERGYAVSRNELIEGAVALAAPFFNGADRVAGSLCIFGPGVRMTEDRVSAFTEWLVAEASTLSKALGH